MAENAIKVKVNSIDRVKRFVEISKEFTSDVIVYSDEKYFDAKSIIALFSLNLLSDLYVEIISEDTNEIERFNKEMEVFK